MFRQYVGDDQHVGAVAVEIEPLGNIFAQNRRRKGTETFAEFDPQVERALHARRARIGNDRSRAKCARAEFHSALKPAYRVLRDQRFDRAGNQRFVIQCREHGAGSCQFAARFRPGRTTGPR